MASDRTSDRLGDGTLAGGDGLVAALGRGDLDLGQRLGLDLRLLDGGRLAGASLGTTAQNLVALLKVPPVIGWPLATLRVSAWT